MMQLGIPGFTYPDLHDPTRLAGLTETFHRFLAEADPQAAAAFTAHAGGARLSGNAEAGLLLTVAAHLSRFVARLFGVEEEAAAIAARTAAESPLFRFKRDFVMRRANKRGVSGRPTAEDFPALDAEAWPLFAASPLFATASGDAEAQCALTALAALDAEIAYAAAIHPAKPVPLAAPAEESWLELKRRLLLAASPRLTALLEGEPLAAARALTDLCERWVLAAGLHPEGRRRTRDWSSLHPPEPIDYDNLVELERPRPDLPEAIEGPAGHRRRRDGFDLTDRRATPRQIQDQLHYCIYCHERDKDSCRRGFTEKPAADGSAAFKRNPLGIALTGCPLEQRISEAHVARVGGDAIGALALICIDNPMLPGTGHRICNDCMKGCIYQKQQPVDIPQIETAILTDVLGLPWGFEIWSLLTRWNPLNVARPEALPYNGKNILVVGLGPAGYTLAHHLLNEGFGVVGVDGLKIEPLPAALTGTAAAAPEPVRAVAERFGMPLSERVLAGFGGVSEYGITVRWNKSFLDILHLNLARRRAFACYGGVRFGGTLTLEDAWEMGFDHVAIATGAGRPTIIPMKGNLMTGIRKASDFLMALQLTGAYKKDALANLQVRLPALVVGGGLTAIDTATELAAYYPLQAEKWLTRHQRLVADEIAAAQRGERGFGSAAESTTSMGSSARPLAPADDDGASLYSAAEERVRARLDPDECAEYDELLDHGRAVRAERERAAAAGETPDFAKLVRHWGGVSMVYRKSLHDSPAYRLNHEEIVKCLEEGITIIESMAPVEALAGPRGSVRAVVFERQKLVDGRWIGCGEFIELPARSVCVAAGTSPNTMYEKEHPGHLSLDGRREFFQSFHARRDGAGKLVLEPAAGRDLAKDFSGDAGFFTGYLDADGHTVSYFGDNHPVYAGSVVRAMASAKDGYPAVAALFRDELAALAAADQPERDRAWQRLRARLDDDFVATVHEVKRLTPTIVEVVVRAPRAARAFQPGQFYRLQNFAAHAPRVEGTPLLMEGLALTGASTDREAGLLSTIVLEMGGSSNLCAALRPGEPVVLMGPTGTPSEIASGEDVLLCGGGLGNAVLFSISKALVDNGNRVVYFAGYRRKTDLFKQDQIEAATDLVIWSVDAGEPIVARRATDRSFVGNIVQAMVSYCEGGLGEVTIPFSGVRRVIAIGSDRMMAAVTQARHTVLSAFLPAGHTAIASINSPMQCMMKEICAQCLQRHRDPVTGKETIVFSCFNQDQEMDKVDFAHLAARLRGNSMQEKIGATWLARLIARGAIDRV